MIGTALMWDTAMLVLVVPCRQSYHKFKFETKLSESKKKERHQMRAGYKEG